MSCPHAINAQCQISTQIAGLPVLLDDAACAACQRDAHPMQENRVTIGRAALFLWKAERQIPPALIGKLKVTGTCRVDPARHKRIQAKAERRARLTSWLIFFRNEDEIGLGDTLSRLIAVAGKREIKADLIAAQKQCACRAMDATRVLNQRYRY